MPPLACADSVRSRFLLHNDASTGSFDASLFCRQAALASPLLLPQSTLASSQTMYHALLFQHPFLCAAAVGRLVREARIRNYSLNETLDLSCSPVQRDHVLPVDLIVARLDVSLLCVCLFVSPVVLGAFVGRFSLAFSADWATG